MAKLEVRTFAAPWYQSIFVWQPIRRLRVLRHPDHPADPIRRGLAFVAETVDADS